MITFRGYSLQHNRWFYGPLFEDKVKAKIYSEELAQWFLVEPKSVGLTMGKADINGNVIYSGDIVRCWPEAGSEYDLTEYRIVSDVILNVSDLRMEVRTPGGYQHGLPINWGGWDWLEVIGNTTESPDFVPHFFDR